MCGNMGYPYPNPPPPPPPPPPPGSSPGRYPYNPYYRGQPVFNQGKPITVSPDALVYLFPEYFAKPVRIGGFKAPYANVKVSHKSLFKAMVTVPLAYMEYMRVADLRLVKKGRLFKSDAVIVVKLAPFNAVNYGLVSGVLSSVGVGQWVELERCVSLVFMEDVYEPEKYFIDRVYKYRVRGQIRIDNQWDLARYRREAEALYNIWMQQRGMKPHVYRVAEKDAEKAANTRRKGDVY